MKTDARHWGAGFSPRGDLSPLADVQAATLLSTGRARVLQDPLFPCETAPLAGLEETRRTVENPRSAIGPRGAGTLPGRIARSTSRPDRKSTRLNSSHLV